MNTQNKNFSNVSLGGKVNKEKGINHDQLKYGQKENSEDKTIK
ncbi:hypothetical protein [Niallia oryzisoli]